MMAPAALAPPAQRTRFEGVRVIAFDLDNTLVDILHLKRRGAEAAAWAMADAGLDLDPAKATEAILAIGFAEGIDRDDLVELYLQRKFGNVDPKFVAIGRQAFERAEDASATPYPRAHRTLIELARRGYHLALVTDAPHSRAVRRLHASRLLPFFSTLITAEDVPGGKATPHPFRLLCKTLGVRPRDILVVGDNPRRDVRSGKRIGCRTVLAKYGLTPAFASREATDRPDAGIAWLDHLLQLLPDEANA